MCASEQDIQSLATAAEENPQQVVVIDLHEMSVNYGESSFSVTMPDSAREALLSARWDTIGELLENAEAIEKRAEALTYV